MKTLKLYVPFLLLLCLMGCDQQFLDAKPDKALLVPTTVADLQALLDNSATVFNQDPNIGQIAADDYYTTTAGMAGLPAKEQNAYLWADDVYAGTTVMDWIIPYRQIFYANVVLDGAAKLDGKASESELKSIRGTALFYRAWALFQLSQLFAVHYDPANAATEPGVPVPLSADVNERPGRGTLAETYKQILADASEAESLLPTLVRFKTRPGNAAASALLARVYLTMGDFVNAEKAASRTLLATNALLDYNTLNAAAAKPLPIALPYANEEILFYSHFIASNFINNSTLTIIDSNLYKSYHNNDLRKVIFFRDRGAGRINFKGSYSGTLPRNSTAVFSGLATDEVYLIRAECRARSKDVSGALKDLNTLLEKRWKQGAFTPVVAADDATALKIILEERRKELVSRGTRWTDLRRLNRESAFAVSLKRALDGVNYSLEPKDLKYVFPIPEDEVQLSGIQQNPR